MKQFTLAFLAGVLALGASTASAAQISGEYIETRTCDVYTGPCFANGQIGLCGREAILGWKVDEGSWNKVDLAGLGVVVVIQASDTLGFNDSFAVSPHPVKSVIIVDERATEDQEEALIAFVKEQAAEWTKDVVRVERTSITLTNDHLAGRGKLEAGNLAKIETRKMGKKDCICTNESVFYPPLTKIQNSQAAYSLLSSFDGAGLGATWTTVGSRSGFLGTFRK